MVDEEAEEEAEEEEAKEEAEEEQDPQMARPDRSLNVSVKVRGLAGRARSGIRTRFK